jgi:hypothetical protein
VGAVAAAVERETLQERRPNPFEADAVDGRRRPEVRLEAALLLRRRDRQQALRGTPRGLARLRLDQQVRHLASARVVEAQVAEAAACHAPRPAANRSGPGLDPERGRTDEQWQVDRQPLRPGSLDHRGALEAERVRIGGRARSARERTDSSGRERSGEADAPAPHAFSRDAVSTYFWSASATSESATASPTNEATR